jgi:hypothetical protein
MRDSIESCGSGNCSDATGPPWATCGMRGSHVQASCIFGRSQRHVKSRTSARVRPAFPQACFLRAAWFSSTSRHTFRGYARAVFRRPRTRVRAETLNQPSGESRGGFDAIPCHLSPARELYMQFVPAPARGTLARGGRAGRGRGFGVFDSRAPSRGRERKGRWRLRVSIVNVRGIKSGGSTLPIRMRVQILEATRGPNDSKWRTSEGAGERRGEGMEFILFWELNFLEYNKIHEG